MKIGWYWVAFALAMLLTIWGYAAVLPYLQWDQADDVYWIGLAVGGAFLGSVMVFGLGKYVRR